MIKSNEFVYRFQGAVAIGTKGTMKFGDGNEIPMYSMCAKSVFRADPDAKDFVSDETGEVLAWRDPRGKLHRAKGFSF